MIDPAAFCRELEARGFSFFSGVPCSYLQGPFARLEERGGYVPAPNEGVAMALAAGAQLAGQRSAVLVQNSGLGNLLDPLTSLLMSYEIPLLIVMSLRGWPQPEDDEPHHAVMGQSTAAVLDAIHLRHGVLEPSEESLWALLDRADAAYRDDSGFVILVPKATFGSCPRPSTGSALTLGRADALAAVAPHLAGALVFSTTGMISRELFGLRDDPANFYMQGSMGHAIGLGLGTALARPDRPVVVVDGDGSTLMHLGGLALVGERQPANLTHLVLDNGTYDSTGGQRTRERPMGWDRLALAVGYRTGAVCETSGEILEALGAIDGIPGPHLVAIRIAPGGATPPRVTSAHSNPEIRARFQREAAGRALAPAGLP
ncbi:phosphonopyruvate decarboxylase [Actinophytocola sp.]|uniref:phosphonopyruvate decarboxylase n=1 Tax=Actinophytocola sp. TaxID=1872138 RepID=UPI002D7E6BA2|nr:phosphonopyruvate decarboxylase [Actinophytocola sp.]HET9140039.1 phosphonopyruvate decarboxylase [Actinophytocola sp.]